MEKTDTRFTRAEKEIFSKLLGATFEQYRCDDRTANGLCSSFGLVGVWVDGSVYAIDNDAEPACYFGEVDDVASFRVRGASEGELFFPLAGQKQTDHRVDRAIEDICLYEDTQVLVEDGVEVFRYSFTSAIVFRFAHSQLVFESTGWMSEDIIVRRGPHAESAISDAESYVPEDDRESRVASRVVVSLRDCS